MTAYDLNCGRIYCPKWKGNLKRLFRRMARRRVKRDWDIQEEKVMNEETLKYAAKQLEQLRKPELAGRSHEEKYTINQILDAITQADKEIIVALTHKDREMLKDILKDFLNQERVREPYKEFKKLIGRLQN